MKKDARMTRWSYLRVEAEGTSDGESSKDTWETHREHRGPEQTSCNGETHTDLTMR